MEEVIAGWGSVDGQLVPEAPAFAGCGVSASVFSGDAARGGRALGDDFLYACDVSLESSLGLRNADGVCGGGERAVHRGAAAQPLCTVAHGFTIIFRRDSDSPNPDGLTRPSTTSGHPWTQVEGWIRLRH